MGEESLPATRLAISDQRAELQRTADQLREALDLRKQFRRNPVPFIAVGAGAVFLIAGGPSKVAGLVRRQFFPSSAEKAYDTLPKPMQSWVDHMAGAVGPRTADARRALSEELHRWQKDPRRNGKISKKLARQIAEGPPGPKRAGWTAFEAGAAIITAALARKVVERFLSGEPVARGSARAVSPDQGGVKPPVPRATSTRRATSPTASDYSGMSAQRVP